MSIELFATDDDVRGADLWKVDTVSGAISLIDTINPVASSTMPNDIGDIVVSDGVGYFSGFDGVSDELWRSDGTTAGTYAVSAPLNEQPVQNVTDVDGEVYYTGGDATQSGIFRTDGTVNGTAFVASLYASHLTALGGKLLFESYSSTGGGQFWSTDGTAAGTTLLMSNLKFWGSSDNIRSETLVGNEMFYTADDGVDGVQIWETDGTQAGTHIVTHFARPYSGVPNDSSPVGNLTAFDGKLYFVGPGGLYSVKEDGTAQTLAATGNQFSLSSQFYVLNNELLFSSPLVSGTGYDVYAYNGSATEVVAAGAQGTAFVSAAVVGTNLFFDTTDQNGRGVLWETDGAAAGTHIVEDFTQTADTGYIYSLSAVGDQLLFNVTDNVHGDAFWISDGAAAGTHVLLNATGSYGSYLYDFSTLSQSLIGGAGYDNLVGGAGNDVIIGGGGADSLTGGAGADTFKYVAAGDSTAQGYDIIQDFQHGVDAIDLTAVAPTYISLVHSGGATYLFPATPGGNMEIAAIGDVEGTDLITGAPVNLYLVADDNGDTLIGGAANDSLHGGAGNDVIIGGGAADALFGGAGADTFKYLAPSDSTPQAYDIIQDFATGVDKLDLTALTPTNVSILHYNGGTFINGVGTNNEVFQIASIHDINAPDIIGLTSGAYIVGDSLGDTLIGASFAETIAGGSGNDVIIGGGGADALYGGGGTNVFKYLAASDSTTSAPDIIHDFVTGVDKIDLTAVHAGSASASYGLAFTATGSYLYVDTNGDGANDMLIEVASPNLHATDILW